MSQSVRHGQRSLSGKATMLTQSHLTAGVMIARSFREDFVSAPGGLTFPILS